MRQSNKVDGTKIAQAAKDLNVTSVTIRRYIAEFGIETTSDENGIKVLPNQAMEELKEIRRLKEEGLTNPKVLEFLEENRKAAPAAKETKSKAKRKAEPVKAQREVEDEDEEEVAEKVEVPAKQEKKKPTARRLSKPEQEEAEEETPPAVEDGDDMGGDGKSKHSLTCQTCGKVFEHMNPRLRDCLECYRAKRKERRRGGADRHKNVIQHPIAQQVASKAAQQQVSERAPAAAPAARERSHDRDRDRDRDREPAAAAAAPTPAATAAFQTNFAPQPPRAGVRNYRKAIEETRQITGSLKRRLERPDLPEGERRWLEQIYAYQLILHQGWRHLAEYRAATQQGKGSGPHTASVEE
jgi:DNA-binding transcriptional MerR regulator